MEMSLRKYLAAIKGLGAVSETALYTPLATYILSGPLNYSAKYYAINKSGAKGTPDIRIFSGEDNSEWIVSEVKLHDEDIRKDTRRQHIWKDQILQRGYIRAETFYVLLCAPRTFYVCDLNGAILDGVHIEDNELIDIISHTRLQITDSNFRNLLGRITFEASIQRPQYDQFRRGELSSGYITLSPETIDDLQDTFDFALRQLKSYCIQAFDHLKQEHQDASVQLKRWEKKREDVGSDLKSQKKVQAQIGRLKRRHRSVLQLFEVDYPQFKHDQTYAGTEKEEHFEDIFITNTAYVALSRLFFVRICEDIGLTTRKISHEGPSLWRRFVENIRERYQDLIEVAYKDVAHIYSKLFEETVFDWYGHGNGQLNDILERILFRLNAFSFKDVSRDVLGRIYQYFRPKAERKRLGEYYTPDEVVDYILAQTGIAQDQQIMTKQILDPACGSFTFGVRALIPLLKASAHLSAENRIEIARRCLIGCDINPFSVFLSHLSLLFATLDIYMEAKGQRADYAMPGFSIYNRNSLTYFPQTDELHVAIEEAGQEGEQTADYVVGNPPFVRNERLPAEDREVLDQLFSAIKSGNTDLSVYFLYCAMRYWLKEGGALGMVTRISTANTDEAEKLRAMFRDYPKNKWALFQVVSLEWMAKEIFPDADIVPMLVFAQKVSLNKSHRITVVSGLRSKSELIRAIDDKKFFARQASQLNYQKWLTLSPTGDWPLEVKAVDLPLLEKLKKQPSLGTIVKTSYAVKLGGKAKFVRPYNEKERKATEVPFIKGYHVCAYNLPKADEMSASDEMIDLAQINQSSGASIWKDLNFYKENEGHTDESGLGKYDYQGGDLVNNNNPSDTLCCFVPEVYVTLIAGVGNPLDVCASNTVSVVIPLKYSAHVIAAIMNSRISRYYAFLLLRSAILLRRRAHWYPRTLRNLPLPDLNDAQAARLHLLAKEAASLSQGVHLNEMDAYTRLVSNHQSFTKAGFIGIQWFGATTIDRDDLIAATIESENLRIGPAVITGEAPALQLLRLDLLSMNKDEIPIEDIQNVMLPEQVTDRQRIAEEIAAVASKLEQIKQRMINISEEIDENVAAGLSLKPREHELIRKRCEQFPLSVTVERPRYVWSPDRKHQARRIYEPGERFK
jgi:hypothetical protein